MKLFFFLVTTTVLFFAIACNQPAAAHNDPKAISKDSLISDIYVVTKIINIRTVRQRTITFLLLFVRFSIWEVHLPLPIYFLPRWHHVPR